MKDDKKGFTPGRMAEVAKTHDVLSRARQATNSAIGQAKDRLGTPGRGGERV